MQISRWDSLKDPIGVLHGFQRHIAEHSEAHLVLAGPSTDSVADDPEGAAVYAAAGDAWRALRPMSAGTPPALGCPITSWARGTWDTDFDLMQRLAAVADVQRAA